ncbi:hypothetical protein [Leclercia sp. LSNIH1]|uniref:hypothetical protein n=1 Tax=Leclercia sp. LSNIH1 TaxID=1920114 RepID=UPI0011132CA6|nr:hypothetical protein [Leclercia sp. LSNIH1]
MKRSILAIIVATSTISAFNAYAEPLQAQAGRDMAAAKAVASLASYNMDKAAKSGDASQISRAQKDLNSALAQVRSTALRNQLAQQRDAQAASIGQLNALKSQDLANQQAQVTAHMNQVTANMSATPNAPAAPVQSVTPSATPSVPSAPASPSAPLTVTVNTASPTTAPGMAPGTVVGAAPAPVSYTVSQTVVNPNLSTAPVAGLPAGSVINGVAAPATLSSTTVANTTDAAALQAALTASKMASSAAAPGVAPSTMNPGVKTNPVGNPVAITSKVANSSINVGVSSVPASTPVQVGSIITTAGAIAAIDSTIQISIPYESVFDAPVKSVHSDHQKNSRSEHGTGNGANNAQASRSAGGFSTAGSHIGGGKSGGGFHY